MKAKMKKIMAIVCAVALMVANITIYKSNVSADMDYSTLTYKTLTCDGGAEFNYCVVEQNITGWVDAPFYGDGGNTFQPIYAGDGVNETSDTRVKINGVDTPVGTGAFTVAASGIVKINPTLLADNAYSTIEIITTSGSAFIVVKKGTPVNNGTDETSTTVAENESSTENATNEGEGSQETSATGEDGTEATSSSVDETTSSIYEPDYSYLTFREGVNGATDLAFATLEDFVYYPLCDDAGRVNLQTKPGEGTEPIYPDFSDLTLNGEPIPAGWYTDKGASIIIPASRVGLIKDRYNVLEGTSAVGGTKFHIIIRYGTPPVDPNKPTTEAPTETTTLVPETTTKSPIQTEKVPTREVEWMQLTSCTAVSVWQDVPPYKYNVTPGTSAGIARDPADRDHVQFQMSSRAGTGSCNLGRTFKGLIPGYKYIISFELTPKVANGKIQIRGIDIPLEEGTTRISFTTTAYNLNGVGQADLTINAWGLGSDAVIDIANMSIEEAVGENPTTTSQTPTTTTKQTETTTTSSKKEETTVSPTTTGTPAVETIVTDNKVSAPAKAKIKKVYSKKKAAKKVKVTLKKINGVSGYQVAVYKAKKGKKAIVKKYVNSTNVTIKSAKLKNKKKLFVRARAYVLSANGTKVYGKWSAVKAVKIK